MMPVSSSQRLDRALVERGLASSLSRAQALIASGLISVDGAVAQHAAQATIPAVQLSIRDKEHPWVGRGGLKLAGALDDFALTPAGRVVLDAGASTGGFTDVLLARGARHVYAVDVRHGQLDVRLAADPRVTVIDRTNLRTLHSLPGEPPNLVTLDLAFISLRLVMPAVRRLSMPESEVVALYKPQFELPAECVGKGGVVRDQLVAERGAKEFLGWAMRMYAAEGRGPIPAAARGAKGNQEWFIYLRFIEGGRSS